MADSGIILPGSGLIGSLARDQATGSVDQMNGAVSGNSGSKTHLQQIRAAQLLSDYKLTPATLMARIDPNYIASKWVLYLSWKIAQCVAKGSSGILISAPPRHGKSMLATVATPLWVLENFPSHNVGVCTYGEDLSTDFSRTIRDHVQQNENLLSVRLRQDVTRVSNFLTTKGGGLKAFGLRGTITGRGFNVLVIDDYIKEPKEAESAKYLEDLYTWYQTVARTRLEPGAVIIIVATRWVKNDLHGKLMKLQALTGRNFFEVVSLPALAYDPAEIEALPPEKRKQLLGYPDPLGRAPGEPLFPERYTKQDMENMRSEMQGRWWSSMFQQNPMGDEGSVIDIHGITKYTQAEYNANWLKPYLANPGDFVVGRYWDMAASKNAGDYTSASRGMLRKKDGAFLIDNVTRGQFGAAKSEAMFEALAVQDLIRFPTIQVGMEEEPGSSGKYSVRHFQKILNESPNIPSLMIRSENAASKGSKLLAAQPFIGAIEKGKVGILEDSWNQDFLDELEVFPEGLKDDQVDSSSGLYRLVKGLIGQSATWGRGTDVDRARQEMATAGAKLPGEITNRIGAVWGRGR